MTYLARQRTTLANRLVHVQSAETKARHVEHLLAAQHPDGGFAGREGGADLYYTAFGLLGLSLLRATVPHVVTERLIGYLCASWERPSHLVDFFSLLHAFRLLQELRPDPQEHLRALPEELRDAESEWGDLVVAGLETCRTPDGGFGRTPGQTSGSTYATFLTLLCHEELNKPVAHAEKANAFLQSRRRDDGGYVELAPMRRSGANPTAAAVASLRVLTPDGMDWASTAAFLATLQGMEGGVTANARAPLADLLSTFTTTWTLFELGELAALDGRAALRFVQGLEMPNGGFRAGAWDDRADVEYTFYGLGALALLGSDVD